MDESEKLTGTMINEWLLSCKPKMAIRVCEDYTYLSDKFIRIGLKDSDKNRQLIKALEAFEG